jgi:Type II restriction endonuclease EcoO109I
LERLIRECLTSFYKRRIAALDKLNLERILGRKNPYLFKASGIQSAPEMIAQLLSAHVSSSDETIFGSEFFEPICRALCGGHIAAAHGSDFVIETDRTYEVIALKSGTNIYNSSQTSKQNEEFEQIMRSLRATTGGLGKEFIPIMGCGYGRVSRPEPTGKRRYFKLAGQSFWEKITGSPTFYLDLVRLMRDDPDRHKPEFTAAWDRAVTRFSGEFWERFCDKAGNILWEKLVEFNSAARTARPDAGE